MKLYDKQVWLWVRS